MNVLHDFYNGLKSVATISPVPSGTFWYLIDLYRILLISEILITTHIIHKTTTKKSRRLDQIVGLEFIPDLEFPKNKKHLRGFGEHPTDKIKPRKKCAQEPE